MGKALALFVIFSLLGPSLLIAAEQETSVSRDTEQRTIGASVVQGKMDARVFHKTGGWVAGGIIGGGLFSLLGTGVVTLIAMSSSPYPNFVPEDVEQNSYVMAYNDEARSRNVRAAGISGLVMSAIWIGIVLATY